MMTELEEKLAQPGAEALRSDLSRRLGELAEHARQHLAEGLPREDYARWQKAAEAIQAANEVIADWAISNHNEYSSTAASPHSNSSHLPRRS